MDKDSLHSDSSGSLMNVGSTSRAGVEDQKYELASDFSTPPANGKLGGSFTGGAVTTPQPHLEDGPHMEPLPLLLTDSQTTTSTEELQLGGRLKSGSKILSSSINDVEVTKIRAAEGGDGMTTSLIKITAPSLRHSSLTSSSTDSLSNQLNSIVGRS